MCRERLLEENAHLSVRSLIVMCPFCGRQSVLTTELKKHVLENQIKRNFGQNTSGLHSVTMASDPIKEAVQVMLPLLGPPVQAAARSALVSKLVSSLPGDTKSMLFGPTKTYKDIFFPGFVKDSHEGLVKGTDFGKWSTALLCSSIKARASQDSLRRQMLSDKIDPQLLQSFTNFIPQLSNLYAGLLPLLWTDFKLQYDKCSKDLAKARQLYYSGFVESLALHNIWAASNIGPPPSWEIWNHILKYLALGASPADVDKLLEAAKEKITVPEQFRSQNWKNYKWDFAQITHEDIDSLASGAINETIFIPNIGGYGASQLPCGNAFDFSAIGKPGNIYREPPHSGSCFTEDTLVVLADKRLVSVKDLKVGNQLWSPALNAAVSVAAVVKPRLNGRELYQIADAEFCFTSTHPFCVEGKAAVACMQPHSLSHWGPAWRSLGISQLRCGVKLQQVILTSGGIEILPYLLESLHVHSNHHPDYELYDIILETVHTPGGEPVDYIAGSKSHLFRVCSELSPLATIWPVVSVISSILPIQATFSPPVDHIKEWNDRLNFYHESRELIQLSKNNWLPLAVELSTKLDKSQKSDSLSSSPPTLSQLATLFANNEGGDNYVQISMSRLWEDFLSVHAFEIATALEMGFRTFDLQTAPEVIAFSLCFIEFDHNEEEEDLLDLTSEKYEVTVKVTTDTDIAPLKWVKSPVSILPKRPYFAEMSQIYYFTAPQTDDITLKVTFSVGNRKFVGEQHMQLRGNYLRHTLQLARGNRDPTGYLEFDSRGICQNSMQEEVESAASWTNEAMQNFASSLSLVSGEAYKTIADTVVPTCQYISGVGMTALQCDSFNKK